MSLLTELIGLLPWSFYKHDAPTELRPCLAHSSQSAPPRAQLGRRFLSCALPRRANDKVGADRDSPSPSVGIETRAPSKLDATVLSHPLRFGERPSGATLSLALPASD